MSSSSSSLPFACSHLGLPDALDVAPARSSAVSDLRALDDAQFLARSFGKSYLITRLPQPQFNAIPSTTAALAPPGHLDFGGPAAFLFDMQGIDCFLYGRAKLFRDETIRRLVIDLDLVSAGEDYLRVGAAGSPPQPGHPGGEVLEAALFHGANGSGRSSSNSGFLPVGHEHSRGTALGITVDGPMLEPRSVYSHTAFLERSAGHSVNVVLELVADGVTVNVLDAIQEFAAELGISAYAIRIFVAPGAKQDPRSVIIGRVLRRLPHGPLPALAHATAIASEQL